MPKIKTHKGMSKRVSVRKKLGRSSYMHKSAMQGHFNSREKSKDTRHKRKLRKIDQTNKGLVRRMLPYSSKIS